MLGVHAATMHGDKRLHMQPRPEFEVAIIRRMPMGMPKDLDYFSSWLTNPTASTLPPLGHMVVPLHLPNVHFHSPDTHALMADSGSSFISLNMSMNREDEESSQTSSLDTLLEKPSVRWRDGEDRDIGATGYGGIRLTTALIVHALLIAAFGVTWLLLLSFYGYEYPYGPNLIQSQKASLYPHLSLPPALLTFQAIRPC